MFCCLLETRKRWKNKTKRNFLVIEKSENVIYHVLHWYALFSKKGVYLYAFCKKGVHLYALY